MNFTRRGEFTPRLRTTGLGSHTMELLRTTIQLSLSRKEKVDFRIRPFLLSSRNCVFSIRALLLSRSLSVKGHLLQSGVVLELDRFPVVDEIQVAHWHPGILLSTKQLCEKSNNTVTDGKQEAFPVASSSCLRRNCQFYSSGNTCKALQFCRATAWFSGSKSNLAWAFTLTAPTKSTNQASACRLLSLNISSHCMRS